jgi:hypothetical protein
MGQEIIRLLEVLHERGSRLLGDGEDGDGGGGDFGEEEIKTLRLSDHLLSTCDTSNTRETISEIYFCLIILCSDHLRLT